MKKLRMSCSIAPNQVCSRFVNCIQGICDVTRNLEEIPQPGEFNNVFGGQDGAD
jgi:hypothetical protein